MLEPPNPGPHSGCPLGALGGGCIGRGYRGDFRRWSLHPGKYSHETVHGNQFSLRIKRGNVIYSKVLSIFDGKQAEKPLRCWDWGVPADRVTYHSVFPRAWTEFREPVPGVNVEILQISPVIPNNYSDASLPCCVFEVNVTNLAQESIECSVMFTFQNSDGTPVDTEPLDSQGFAHSSFTINKSKHCDAANLDTQEMSEGDDSSNSADMLTYEGVCMARHHITRVLHDEATSSVPLHVHRDKAESGLESPNSDEDVDNRDPSTTSSSLNGKKFNHDEFVYSDPGSFAIATTSSQNVEDNFIQDISTCDRFVVSTKDKRSLPTNYISASDLWSSFHETGSLRSLTIQDGIVSGETSQLKACAENFKHQSCAAAVCAQRCITVGSTPALFKFALAWDNPVVRFGAGRGYLRYHSRFFGSSGLSAPSIAAYALHQVDLWNSAIEEWQHSIVEDDSLPEYYRHLLFNELYYLVDGGTVWIEAEPMETVNAKSDNESSRRFTSVPDSQRNRLLPHVAVIENNFIGTTECELASALSCQSSVQVDFIAEYMKSNDVAVEKCQVYHNFSMLSVNIMY